MSWSSRHVLPVPAASLPVADVEAALPPAQALPTPALPRRLRLRRGSAAGENGTITKRASGRAVLLEQSSADAARGFSIRRQPTRLLFPEAYDQRPQEARATDPAPSAAAFIRSASVGDMLTVEYQRKLRAVFDLCDGDNDGELIESEFALLLELMGIENQEEIDATTLLVFGGGDTSGISFTTLLHRHRLLLVTCAASYALPRPDLLLRCKRLKYGFNKIDGDSDQGVTRPELEIAMQKLNIELTDVERDRIFSVLDRDSDGSVDWSDFVYSAYRNTLASVMADTRTPFTIDVFADLPIFIRPAPQARSAAAATMASSLSRGPSLASLSAITTSGLVHPDSVKTPKRTSFGSSRSTALTSIGQRASEAVLAIERIGIEYLTSTSMEHVTQAKKTIATVRPAAVPTTVLVHQSTMRTGFSAPVRRRIRVIEATAALVGALIGVLCGLLSIWLETLVDAHWSDRATLYYVYVVLVNVAVSILEVHGLYATAVVCAFRLTVCTNLKLYPQDPERKFLTRSIARAALQVAHRKDRLFGIDPMRGSPRAVLYMTFLVYKGKRYVLKFLLKLLIKRVLWRAAAKTMLSLLVLPINGVMNAWTIRGVMLNCRVSIIGPPCTATLLEKLFIHDDQFTGYERVDLLRVVGAVLVVKRKIHPNLELMVDHMRHHWLKPELWPVTDDCCCLLDTDEPCARHSLDNVDLLVASVQLYASQTIDPSGSSNRQHLRNVLSLLVIALIIDGGIGMVERRLYFRLCHAGRMQPAWNGVQLLRDGFLAGKGIHIDAVYALVQELPANRETDKNDEQVPWRESLAYTASRVSQFLSW